MDPSFEHFPYAVFFFTIFICAPPTHHKQTRKPTPPFKNKVNLNLSKGPQTLNGQ